MRTKTVFLFWKLCLMGCLAVNSFSQTAYGQLAQDQKITVLYDNYCSREGTREDWGFSCLLEGFGEPLLFDTGTKPLVLAHNIQALDVDLARVRMLVISHNHQDHTGGLLWVLEQNHDITVYLPSSTEEKDVKKVRETGADVHLVKDPAEICPGVWTTGELPGVAYEQSLVLRTSRGWVLLTGCSHPGIINIITRAKKVVNANIYMVLGGFHLLDYTPEQTSEIIRKMKELGVEYCGASHCTGDSQIQQFKEAFGPTYVSMGTGQVINLK
jgi:7,8-dihydropterin-6-yl-methyl-4-(beta-D-ribofuranosyl)aminobenzene 5'-phosphate synthase